MVTRLTGRGRLSPALAGVLLCGLAAPARGDEMRYLPTGTNLIVSIDVPAFLKSKTYQDMKKLIPSSEKIVDGVILVGESGVPTANMARLTQGIASLTEEPAPFEGSVTVVTTTRPVTAADVKVAKKLAPFMKNVTYKEVKVGAYTIHEQNFQAGKDDTVQKGDSFCVAEGNIVLYGRLETLKKVLERNKAPELSANMRAGLKQAGFANTLAVVVDLESMPARGPKEEMLRKLPVPGLKDLVKDLQTFALKANENDRARASATLFCKDAASAARARKVAALGLAAWKATLKDDPKMPARLQDLMKEIRPLFAAIKLSAKGNQATADAVAEPALAVKFFRLPYELELWREEEASKQRKDGN